MKIPIGMSQQYGRILLLMIVLEWLQLKQKV